MKKVWSSIKGWFAYKGDGVIALIIVYTLLVFATIFCAWLLSGCNTSKEIQRTSVDSTGISKADSGNVTKTGINYSDSWEWWKNTVIFDTTSPMPGLIIYDTNGNRKHQYVAPPSNEYHYQPYNVMPQPKVIILEGGKGKTETIIYQTDSSWRNKYDSLAYQVEQVVKKKHTEVLTLWHLIGVGIGTALLIWLLVKLNKVKI